MAKLVGRLRGRRNFEDSLGSCIFTIAHARWRTSAARCPRPPAGTTRSRRRCASAAAPRAILRAFNLRCGIDTESSTRPTRYGSQPVDGPAKGQAIGKQWERMLDVWYERSATTARPASPLPKTLKKLGLDWLAKELWGSKA